MAMELDIPVIAAAQLNRQVEGRTDSRPKLSDLRDSGSLEQDADIVTTLYRPDYYENAQHGSDPQPPSEHGQAPRGQDGMFPMTWHPEFTRFDAAKRESTPPYRRARHLFRPQTRSA
jgi:replicative DNA helicase